MSTITVFRPRSATCWIIFSRSISSGRPRSCATRRARLVESVPPSSCEPCCASWECRASPSCFPFHQSRTRSRTMARRAMSPLSSAVSPALHPSWSGTPLRSVKPGKRACPTEVHPKASGIRAQSDLERPGKSRRDVGVAVSIHEIPSIEQIFDICLQAQPSRSV